ncbi:tRNA (adenosine(37)-N6)-threonylcarbamoyltransferase complex dimerization subunit type 1 TsaB [Petroclostridium sp. X23]|uniref:tRNA (adenosine(37)-N6)-threonylcarbamoyltransferase complex dimerization subunit type 1 TsaB n=1 Tax=Petroclostridium sp. X23 TaxID=3045146 RepID=UPI0024ACE38F|nr:tRNA (adenosine(37)-N6)-threonylcarbamoyltransferase complex dimerization subunit type 1 TsaB [Petroclostridium sp. X23]WHH57564.1 tRNA (adenosine(37)-N6)-threonylcarbamoyltransferase complex dimerization subunit type 1 TsaB [Petroclostridium sp. X23]
MKVLAVDTSSIVATAAILEDDKLIGEYILNHKKTHSQKLMPMIKEILSSAALKVEDIDVFAAANGPGSFTGLRIGVATVKGLAHAVNKPVVGISTLDGLAFNLPFCQYLVCPIMDARREQVYNALYKWIDKTFYMVEGYRGISLEQLIQELKARNEKVMFTGDGVAVFRDKLVEGLGELCEFAPVSSRMQRASSIAELAMQKAYRGETESYMTFSPFYLRKSQAEREYEKKCGEECG